jgi:hypothetical protein
VKQPDLQWWVETSFMPQENKGKVIEAVRSALRISDEHGKIVWW